MVITTLNQHCKYSCGQGLVINMMLMLIHNSGETPLIGHARWGHFPENQSASTEFKADISYTNNGGETPLLTSAVTVTANKKPTGPAMNEVSLLVQKGVISYLHTHNMRAGWVNLVLALSNRQMALVF